MKGVERLWEEAERKIYESNVKKPKKADLLIWDMGMSIIGGLISAELTAGLVARRRDMVIESAARKVLRQLFRIIFRVENLEAFCKYMEKLKS